MSQQGKRKTKLLLDFQTRNQFGTPGGRRVLRRGQFFLTMCNNFKIRPTHFSCGGENVSKGGFASSGYGPVDFYTSRKINIFLRTLSVLAKFDLASQGVRQPEIGRASCRERV